MQCVQYLSYADENVCGSRNNPQSHDDDRDGDGYDQAVHYIETKKKTFMQLHNSKQSRPMGRLAR